MKHISTLAILPQIRLIQISLSVKIQALVARPVRFLLKLKKLGFRNRSPGSVQDLPLKLEKMRISYPKDYSNWRWRLHELFVKIGGYTPYLWRAVDHEGDVLETIVTRKRDKKSALKLLKKRLKRYGLPTSIVTDRLRSYHAAMNELG